MGNRVEELERQVAELRAAVDGLTEELVETKERVNALESDGESVERETRESGSSHAEFVPNHSADDHAASGDANAGATDTGSTDVSTGREAEIVDADATDTGGTGASGGSSTRPDQPSDTGSDATETAADDEEDSDDDIIVA